MGTIEDRLFTIRLEIEAIQDEGRARDEDGFHPALGELYAEQAKLCEALRQTAQTKTLDHNLDERRRNG